MPSNRPAPSRLRRVLAMVLLPSAIVVGVTLSGAPAALADGTIPAAAPAVSVTADLPGGITVTIPLLPGLDGACGWD